MLRAFEAEQLEYVLLGATAMGFHGLVRATEDVDLLIRATEENVARLRRAFTAVYTGEANIDEIRAVRPFGRLPGAALLPSDW